MMKKIHKEDTAMKTQNRAKLLTTSALFAALLAVACPFVIPIGTIGITAATAVLLFAALTASPSEAITATVLYLSLGAVGLPVFSHFTAGAGAFLAPSGGFLIGYLPFVAIVALVNKRTQNTLNLAIAAIAAHSALYLIGCTVFMLTTDSSLTETLTVTVLPFLIPDAIKTAITLPLARLTHSRLPR